MKGVGLNTAHYQAARKEMLVMLKMSERKMDCRGDHWTVGPSEDVLLDNSMLWFSGVWKIVAVRARVYVRKYPSAVGSQDRPTKVNRI